MEVARAEAAVFAEMKHKLEAASAKSAELSGALAEVTAELQASREGSRQLEKDAEKLQFTLEAERTQAADGRDKKDELAQQLATTSAELETEVSKNRELMAGLGQQSTE